MAWTCILFSSCGVLSYFESMGREAILWEELEKSVDEETAAKDTTSFHNARYQVKSRIVMSDLERVSYRAYPETVFRSGDFRNRPGRAGQLS